MVEERLTDGKRIAQLLASEISGEEGRLADLTVTDADPDVEPTPQGAHAFGVDYASEPVADVMVHPDRARVEFEAFPDVAAEAGDEEGLRVRPKAVTPPKTIVFVEDGAQVKWVMAVFERVVEEIDEAAGRP